MIELEGGRGVPEGFLELPGEVYRDDPMWIPEEAEDVSRAFSPDNPWFRTNRAVLMSIPGSARLAVFYNPSVRIKGRAAAFFGYWETTGERGDDLALFEKAREWAGRLGARDLYGPLDFSTHGRYRLRVSAEPGAVTYQGEPYNPPGYPRLLESLGFNAHHRYLTQIGGTGIHDAALTAAAPVTAALVRDGYRIEPLSHETWLDNLEEMHRLVDAVFRDNFAYSPLPWEAFSRGFGRSLIRKACPVASVVAYGPDQDIAGFFLVYPNYGPIVTRGAGDARVAVSDLDYGRHHALVTGRPGSAAIARTVGVHPSHRGRSIFDALGAAVIEQGRHLYESFFGALILEGNVSQRFGARFDLPLRRYVLYRSTL